MSLSQHSALTCCSWSFYSPRSCVSTNTDQLSAVSASSGRGDLSIFPTPASLVSLSLLFWIPAWVFIARNPEPLVLCLYPCMATREQGESSWGRAALMAQTFIGGCGSSPCCCGIAQIPAPGLSGLQRRMGLALPWWSWERKSSQHNVGRNVPVPDCSVCSGGAVQGSGGMCRQRWLCCTAGQRGRKCKETLQIFRCERFSAIPWMCLLTSLC